MQKKVFVLALSALLPTLALAHNSTLEQANRELGIAVGGQALSYHEYSLHGTVNPLDSESGKQPALRLKFAIQGVLFGMRNLYMHLNFNYAQGSTHYQGYSQTFSTGALSPLSTSTHDDTYAATFRVGKGFQFGSRCEFQLTPELVYSYDNWHRSTGVSTGIGYLEVYQHQAAGVGLLGQAALGRFVFGLQVTGEKTFGAAVNSPFFNNLPLGGRYASSEEFNVDYRISGAQHLTLALTHERFLYGHSAIVQSPTAGAAFAEPNSETSLNSAYVGWAWSF